jgi:8-oxo-dGTP pyrophosphatase MutT (NUDIX family)
MLLHISPRRSSTSRFPWRLHIHWGDAGEFKEEQHPRKKGGQFAKKGAGEAGGGKEIPAPPQIKSQHATNIGKQKHLNQLHQHAKAGEWGKVEAYPTPGSNTYAKMVQKYKAELLKHPDAAGASEEPGEKPAAAAGKLKVPPLYATTLKKTGFTQTALSYEGNALFNNEAGGSILVKPPTAAGENSTWEYLGPGGAKFSGTGLASLQSVIESTAPPEAPAEKVSPLKVTKAAQAAGFELSGTPGTMVNPASGHVLTAKPEGQWSIKEKNGDLVSSGGSFETLKNDLEFGAAKGEYGKAKPEAPAAAEVVKPPKAAAALYSNEQYSKWSADPQTVAETAMRYSNGTTATETEALVIGEGVNNKGKWQIWQKGKGVVAKGSGQNELNAAFEALHPRGRGGKFAKSNKVENFTAGSPVPDELNGVAFKPYAPGDWSKDPGLKPDLVEPPMNTPPGKHASAGLLIQEPDGRVWIVKPKGAYGGAKATFPKGTIDPGETPQQAALREAFEESGLHGEITGLAGDYLGQASLTRYYLAKRIGGSPAGYGPESSGVSLVPPEELGKFLNQDRDKKIAGEHFPPAPPKATIGAPVDVSKMKKIGGQIGSNPGGKYEDADGNQYYAKFLKTPDHAKNELLAASLYDAAKSPVLTYHPDKDDKTIVTDWQQPDKPGGVQAMSPAERRGAQAEFATHAWLGNWDAAGTGGDNQQMIGGQPTTVDVGGALLYRAQGSPKGSAWNDAVDEWDTLRNPAKSPYAADLFGTMTKDQLQESVKKVAGITDAKIRALVKEHGPGGATEKNALADTLIKRRDALIKKAKDLDPPKPLEPHAMRAKIAGWNPPQKPEAAVTDYKGNGYKPMNNLTRFMVMEDDDQSPEAQHVREVTAWLDKASSKEPLVLYRGIRKDYVSQLNYVAKPGRTIHDAGFMSMSTSKSFADGWHGGTGLTMKITLPAGAKIATVYPGNHSDSEYEVLAQRGSKLKITKWDKYAGTYEVELDQSHL